MLNLLVSIILSGVFASCGFVFCYEVLTKEIVEPLTQSQEDKEE